MKRLAFRRALVVASAALPALALACGSGVDENLRRTFAAAQETYLTRDYAKADRMFADVYRGSPGSEEAWRSMYWGARCRLLMKGYPEAEKLFGEVAASGEPEALRALGFQGLGDVRFEMGEFAEARENYKKALENPGREVPCDEILFQMATCYWREGTWEEAKRCFARVAAEYPRSIRAQEAARYLEKDSIPGESKFYVQAGIFATRSGAEELLARLKGRGFDARIDQTPRGSGSRALCVVKVGRFDTWTQAQAEALRLKSNSFDAMVKP